MRRRGDDIPVRIVEALAILFTVLLFGLEIRHLAQGGDIYAAHSGLAEAGLQASAALAIVLGLVHVRARAGGVVPLWGGRAISALALAIVVFGLFAFANPVATGENVGGRVVNLILLGYAVPAALAALVAYATRNEAPRWFSYAAAACAVALSLAYVTLQTKRLFQGPVLTAASTDAEWYAYSAVWLGFGVALLIGGALFRSRAARIASAAVIALTVGKVFVSDLAHLDGALRALSLLGLGAVLIGIGWWYQRLMRTGATSPSADDGIRA
jgi:uncharacterized membrane protein